MNRLHSIALFWMIPFVSSLAAGASLAFAAASAGTHSVGSSPWLTATAGAIAAFGSFFGFVVASHGVRPDRAERPPIRSTVVAALSLSAIGGGGLVIVSLASIVSASSSFSGQSAEFAKLAKDFGLLAAGVGQFSLWSVFFHFGRPRALTKVQAAG
ncbi:MAG: hypothetical protein Q8L55_09480 [Phycisphaerales bacterium]|nr:hypothetical protein [Phycisphaerales bacterium]